MRQARDSRIILAARGLRQFSYGLLAVVLAVSLTRAGYSPPAIGAIITVSLIGDFCSTYVVGLNADHWGRRRTLAALAALMAATGAVFGLTRFYPLLLIAAFFGTLGTSASETAPFLPIEQAMLPQTCPRSVGWRSSRATISSPRSRARWGRSSRWSLIS